MGSYPPLSLGYVAAYVDAQGHEVNILDLQVPTQHERWEELLIESRPDIIGFTALSPSIDQAGSLALQAKKIVRSAKIVAGGYHVTVEPELTLHQYPAFDYVVIGEGERTMAELCERIQTNKDVKGLDGLAWRERDRIGIGPKRERITDINVLPRPHDFYGLDYYLDKGSFTHQYGFTCASIVTARGCPFSCRFCGIPGKYVHQSVKGVVEEVEELLQQGAEGIFFRDSTFTINREWVLDFCDEVMQRRLSFKWIANARPDRVDMELLGRMKRAGCFALCYGVESGRDHVLRYYGKGHTVNDTRRAVQATKHAGIRVIAYFMLGAIVENRADIEESYRFAKELSAERTIWKIFIPLPGSKIYDEFREKGISLSFDKLLTDKATVALADMTKEEIEKRHAELTKEFSYAQDNRLKAFYRQMCHVNSLKDIWQLGHRVSNNLGKMLAGRSGRSAEE